ncbi:hypothetical protein [Sphingomonas glacialis]|uniref:Uncharacterized protein n=1 Tax=Sphingomonas glacialis TaxID=658225 RepID=A0A502FFQ1_9SPHN|nr:hypothetical protein [Sphingomonas glacialis]TPG48204.1 hypothetical protein EAH76_20455 [Sphingomonas glacialis]
MSMLTLRYQYDSSFFDPKQPRDDFGWLGMKVETDRFSGNGGFWVQWQDVREFGEALSAFPITPDHPIVGQWGYEMQMGDDLILRIDIVPANKRGDLAIHFEVAGYALPWDRARCSFTTKYPDLEAFRADIAVLMDRKAEEAILVGI